MDFEQIKNNLLSALSQLLALRLIVTSPNEKVADVPVLFALIVVLHVPVLCVAVAVLGFVLHYGARFEKDVQI